MSDAAVVPDLDNEVATLTNISGMPIETLLTMSMSNAKATNIAESQIGVKASSNGADPTSSMPIHITNILATFDTNVRLDLKSIALKARNAEYNPKRFPGCMMRIREPKTTAMIFASGKVTVVGAKSTDDSLLASRKFARIIQKLGNSVTFDNFKIQNIAASTAVDFNIRLEALQAKHYKFSSYEPEIFPALFYRVVKPKVMVIVFMSGKMVVTGAKSVTDIYQVMDSFYYVVKEFARPMAPPHVTNTVLQPGQKHNLLRFKPNE